jgi:arylsulfatase
VNGIEQLDFDGVSMDYTFAEDGTSTRSTQYFEILGNRAIYHDGWIASCFHGRVPWIRMQAYEFDGPDERWELYDVANDFSQSVDLAAEQPERLAMMRDLFDREARRNGVYPLRDAGSPRNGPLSVPHTLGGRTRMVYGTAHVRLPESTVINLKNCSWRISASITVDSDGADGVIACQGGNMSGWSLWLEHGSAKFTYNCFGHDITTIASPPIEPGQHRIVVDFAYDGGFGAGGVMVISVDGITGEGARIERTVPLVYSMSGETFDVGIDTGSPVGPYPHDYRCTATIEAVVLERLNEPDPAIAALVAEGMWRAGLSTQ